MPLFVTYFLRRAYVISRYILIAKEPWNLSLLLWYVIFIMESTQTEKDPNSCPNVLSAAERYQILRKSA